MPHTAPLRRTLPALLAIVALGCESSSPLAPPPREPLPPLATATWFVHSAEGQSLPALVAHRLESGDYVQDFLDSARVQVTAAGTWTRTMWLSRYRAGSYESSFAGIEGGTWVAGDSAYTFTADVSGRSFSVRAMTPGDSVVLPVRGFGEGYVLATLRTSSPPPAVVGSYRVTHVQGAQVPSAIYVFNNHDDGDGRIVSIHLVIDSVKLELRHTGQYQHAIYHTEWEGENFGPPTTVRSRWATFDFGSWTRNGGSLSFESGWLQNLRFGGTATAGGTLELQHGISHGDEPVPMRYAR